MRLREVYKTYFLLSALVLTGCGGPPFEEQLFFDSTNDSGVIDSGPEATPEIDADDLDAAADIVVASIDSGGVYEADAYVYDACTPLPSSAQRWGTQCEEKCEVCASLYTCECLRGCGQAICPTSTFHCTDGDGSVLVEAACY